MEQPDVMRQLQILVDRVDFVEKEMKLLKAEIKATLLEIHSYLLSDVYPTLQRDASMDGHAAAPAKQWAVKKYTPGDDKSVPGYYSEEPEPPQPTYARPAPALVAARPAQPEQSREATSSGKKAESNVWREILGLLTEAYPPAYPPSTNAASAEPEPPHSAQTVDIGNWIELDKWVNEKVKAIGIEATRELIDLYAGNERMLLQKLLKVYEESNRQPNPNSATFPLVTNKRATGVTERTRQAVAEQWLKYASDNKNGSLNASSEDEELVLRFIADLLNSRAAGNTAAVSNGYSKR
jgi:hypothetical protein